MHVQIAANDRSLVCVPSLDPLRCLKNHISKFNMFSQQNAIMWKYNSILI